MRKCRICEKILLETEFYKHIGYSDGLDHACKECQREYQRKFRRLNPDVVRQRSKKIRERDNDKIKERQKEYYERTKDDPYYVQKRKERYDRNKDRWHQKEREKRRIFNEKWKKTCEKCGESRLYLIQFHHIDPNQKSFCIGANATSKSEDILTKEIAKCVCLCSNCHDEFHYFYGQKPSNPAKSLSEYLGKTIGGVEDGA